MKRTLIAVTCVVAWASCTRDNPYVAEVHGVRITVDEFKERYTAFLDQRQGRENIQVRKEILNNMINERLIFHEINRLGLDCDDNAKAGLEEIRMQALLDGYARRISTDTLKVTDREMEEEFRTLKSKASARYLYSLTEGDAWQLKRQLDQGATFDSLAREVFDDPGLANNGGYLGYFGGGEMEPALEEVVFSRPVGSISDPVKLAVGYAIIKVEDRVRAPLASEHDYAKEKHLLYHAVFEKKSKRLISSITRSFVEELKPRFNDSLLGFLMDNWAGLIDQHQTIPPEGHRTAEFRDMSHGTLVQFSGESWTVDDLIKNMARTTARQQRRVKNTGDLKEFISGIAVRDVLLRRASAEGMLHDDQVRDRIRKASDAFFLKRWQQLVQDTVGQSGWNDAELHRFYAAGREHYVFPPEVNVSEILVRTELEAQDMRARVRKGADFQELARRHSIRLWAAKRGGELGFGTRASFGILGDELFHATPGTVIGPRYVDPYYGVFKVTGHRAGRPKTFDEARSEIMGQISGSRKQEAFKRSLELLRSRYTVTTDIEQLANVVIEQPR